MYAEHIFKSREAVYATIILGLCALFLWAHTANAASLHARSGSTILSPGQTTTLSILVNTQGVSINNAEAKLSFPADKIEILSIQKTNSIFSLWVEDPSFSNTAGIVTFNGGIPNPGYLGTQGLIVSLVIRAKSAGQAEFVFSNTAVRANDGQGTNVLTSQQGQTITIAGQSDPASALPQPVTSSVAALNILSDTHPSQDVWYANDTARFAWAVPTGVNAVRLGYDDNPDTLPQVLYAPPISERELELEDGITYFSAQTRTAEGWGPIARYQVRIDTKPPKVGAIELEYDKEQRHIVLHASAAGVGDKDNTLTIQTLTSDETSGVAFVSLQIDGSREMTLEPHKLATDKYIVPIELDDGPHVASVRVFDLAGNYTDSAEVTFMVESSEAHDSWFAYYNFLVIVISVLAFLVFVSLLFNIILWEKLKKFQRHAALRDSAHLKEIHHHIREAGKHINKRVRRVRD